MNKRSTFLRLCLLLLSGGLHAQNLTVAPTPDPVRAKLDHLFAHLDKSQVPTGRLLDAALPLAPLHHFRGRALTDSSRTDMNVFRALYATALSSRVFGSDTLPSIQTLNQQS